jgi:hypothetical protein
VVSVFKTKNDFGFVASSFVLTSGVLCTRLTEHLIRSPVLAMMLSNKT